jgi:hypothetical protein
MADRYWVGGTGTWDGTSTTNWSTATGLSFTASCSGTVLTTTGSPALVAGMTVWSSTFVSLGTIVSGSANTWVVSVGGTYASQSMSAATVGASVPTASDSVFFDANSNSSTTAFTVTMATTPRVCNDFTASGLDGTMTLAGTSIGLTVSGSLTFQATNFTRSYTGLTTFNATTTGKTITTNGVTFASVTFDGVGGGWTLGSAFTATSGTFTLTNGTLDTSSVSNYALTLNVFSSSGAATRTLNLNSSTFTITSSSAGAYSISASLTLNVGFSTIAMSGLSPTFDGIGKTYYNFSFTNTSATSGEKTVTGANTFNDFTVVATSASASACNAITISANQTISGTLTVVGSGGIKRQFLKSSVIGTPRTLTCAAITAMTDIDFRDITIAGAAGTLSGTRLGDCGGNSNITFGAGVQKYWNLAAGGSWNATAWATSSGGAVADTNFPLAQDTANIENANLNTSATITFNNFEYNLPGLNASTRTNALTIATTGANNPIFYGNFAWGSGLSTSSARTFYFINRSTKTFDSAGYTFSTPNIAIEAPGGGIQLVNNNFTLGSASTTTLTQGTLDLNGRTFTAGVFTTATGTKNITFNAGTLAIAGSGATAWNNAVPTGFTTTAGTGTGTLSMTSASAKTFVGGGSTYNCTLNQGGAGTLTISGSNTFTNITNTVQPNQITFTAGTTNTFTSFSLSGTAGNLITLRSSSAGTRYYLSDASGIISVSYLDIQDSVARGGANWRAYTTNGNVNSGNNSGWLFSPSTGNFLMLF